MSALDWLAVCGSTIDSAFRVCASLCLHGRPGSRNRVHTMGRRSLNRTSKHQIVLVGFENQTRAWRALGPGVMRQHRHYSMAGRYEGAVRACSAHPHMSR